MKNRLKFAALIALVLVLVLFSSAIAFASSPTDEILNYTMVMDVQEDASVNIRYHIEWKVLESDGIGPVDWVSIGLPNRYSEPIDYENWSENIDSICIDHTSDSFAQVYFKKAYYEGEVISFDFAVNAANLYQMNAYENGYTTYFLTSGWFDEIAIDELVMKWNCDKVERFDPDARQIDGYYVWNSEMEPGDYFKINVTYLNDAFEFSDSGKWQDDPYDPYDPYDPEPYNSGGDFIFTIMSLMPMIFIIVAVCIIKKAAEEGYDEGANFGSGSKKKITRTKVVYYPVCQGCGATRKDGEENCEYCGRSFVQSEEILEEDEIEEEDKSALKYKNDGLYHYGSAPNTFVRVHVVNVPTSSIHSGGSGSHSSRGHSSCAHSSCACACVSCACACACACAGGGRAGCTTKDFYNTNLKLKQLEKRAKK